MKLIAGIVGAILIASILVSGAFLALNKACSLGDSPIIGQQIQKSGDDKHPQRAETGEQGSSPQGDKPKPSAIFELRKTDTNKVEGRYYAENAGQEKEAWSHKFFCDTKIGEFALAIFTLVLVIFTGGLWWSTHGLLQAGNAQLRQASYISRLQDARTKESIRLAEEADKTSRIAAHAADRSARAAIALQLPIIRIKPETLGWGDSFENGVHKAYCSVDSLTFSNLGPTKAFPIDVRCGWALRDGLPPEPVYFVTEAFLPNYIFEPDPKITPRKRLDFNIPLDPGDWSLIREGKLDFWFYCELGYDDFMQTRHEARFCWRWQNVGMGMDWRADVTPAYNRRN